VTDWREKNQGNIPGADTAWKWKSQDTCDFQQDEEIKAIFQERIQPMSKEGMDKISCGASCGSRVEK
jgi:hypothetical protein